MSISTGRSKGSCTQTTAYEPGELLTTPLRQTIDSRLDLNRTSIVDDPMGDDESSASSVDGSYTPEDGSNEGSEKGSESDDDKSADDEEEDDLLSQDLAALESRLAAEVRTRC